MIEDDTYCIDIMYKNMAVTGLLRSAHQMLMEDQLNSCFSQAVQSSDKAKKADMLEEILTVTKLVKKCISSLFPSRECTALLVRV